MANDCVLSECRANIKDSLSGESRLKSFKFMPPQQDWHIAASSSCIKAGRLEWVAGAITWEQRRPTAHLQLSLRLRAV